MKKVLTFLFLFLLVLALVVSGCGRTGAEEVSTPLDKDISETNAESSDLNETDLQDLDSDLEAIEDL